LQGRRLAVPRSGCRRLAIRPGHEIAPAAPLVGTEMLSRPSLAVMTWGLSVLFYPPSLMPRPPTTRLGAARGPGPLCRSTATRTSTSRGDTVTFSISTLAMRCSPGESWPKIWPTGIWQPPTTHPGAAGCHATAPPPPRVRPQGSAGGSRAQRLLVLPGRQIVAVSAYRPSCTRAKPLDGISVRQLRLACSASAPRPARPIRVPLASRCG
jgi:hypothetical protein